MELQVQQVDEIEADVECLMCARVIGQLFGHTWRTGADRRSAHVIANLATYRDNAWGAQPRPVLSHERFRCGQCGGQAFVGEILVREAA
jgi:hypothetical protein